MVKERIAAGEIKAIYEEIWTANKSRISLSIFVYNIYMLITYFNIYTTHSCKVLSSKME